jgi:CRP/FNR family transcriptional regulator
MKMGRVEIMGRLHQEDGPFWCLLNVNLFEQLKPEEMDELNHWVKSIFYRKGEAIFLPGDPSDFVYFLHRGRVKLAYLDESGKRLTLSICRVGELFGEMALVGEQRRKLVAEALEDVELCIVAGDDLMRFADQHHDFSIQITRAIGSRMNELETRLQDLVFKDVPTRLARLLYRLKDDYGVDSGSNTLLDVKLTHRDLADLIGSTRETTTATLNDFVRQGILDKQKGRLVIQNEARLIELAHLDEY